MAYGRNRKPTELDERARRAVKRFRAMLPGLNAYARAVSGNPRVKIEITRSNGSSTADRIYFQPPIKLGDDLRHDTMHCEKRDQDGIQICDACRTREGIMVVIYHEIGHISKGTFEVPTADDVNFIHHRGADLQPSETAKQNFLTGFPTLWKKYRQEKDGNTYMGLAGTVTPFLPVLFNAIEDARVNEQVFAARRGVRRMYDAMMAETARDGIPDADGGEPTHWRDASSNYQMMLGVYSHLAGYDYLDWFQPEVVTELANPELLSILKGFNPQATPGDSLRFTCDVMQQLNKQGFARTEEPDPPQEEEQDDGSDEPGDDQGESGEGDESESSEDQSESGEAQGSGGEGSGESQPGSGSSGQDWSKQQDQSNDSADSSSGPGQEAEAESDPEDDDDAHDGEPEDSSDGGVGDDEGEVDQPSGGSGDEPSSDQDETDVSGEGTSESDKQQAGEDLSDDQEVDTGADKGEGGIKIRSWDDRARPYDKAEDMEGMICAADQRGYDSETEVTEDSTRREIEMAKQIIDAVVRAAMQETYFETPSFEVQGVELVRYGTSEWYGDNSRENPTEPDVTEAVLSRALLELRVALDANRRSDMLRHRKSGKVNSRVLGKRAPLGDDRLFMKKKIPEKRDYFVVIGIDISYSTYGRNLRLMKQAVYAQAELLHRLGVPFAIYGHSHFESLNVYLVKEPGDSWDSNAKLRLMDTQAINGNLDGHALEFLRKRVEESTATDKIVLYYSDGKMPASNHDEELEILQREIRYCQRKSITLLGVGIRTDSPKEHGLETVEVNGSEDTVLVVRQLQKHLVHR